MSPHGHPHARTLEDALVVLGMWKPIPDFSFPEDIQKTAERKEDGWYFQAGPITYKLPDGQDCVIVISSHNDQHHAYGAAE